MSDDESAGTVMVRAYVTESHAHLERLLARLRSGKLARGVTAYRAVAGFGTRFEPDPDQLAHPDDPPIVIEYFGPRAEAMEVARQLRGLTAARHVVAWAVQDVA